MIGLLILPHLTSAQEAAVVTPGAAILFLSPHFFAALLVGIALAVAFQVALPHLSVAAGVSAIGPPKETSILDIRRRRVKRMKGSWKRLVRSPPGMAFGH